MNNQAPELSPEARRLINQARGADDPTAEDQARVKARWLASVAAVAGVSSLTEAARAAGGIGWGLKAAGAALVVAAGAIGLNFALDRGGSAGSEAAVSQAPASKQAAPLPGGSSSSPERFQKAPRSEQAGRAVADAPGAADPASAAAPSPQPALAEALERAAPESPEVGEPAAVAPQVNAPQVNAPQVGTPTAGTPTAALEAVAGPSPPAVPVIARAPVAVRNKPAARAAVARAGAPKPVEKDTEAASAATAPVEAASAAAGPSGQLSEELAVLSDVRGSIQEGAAVRALELLNRYESRFGQPILGMEADALRVDALCKAGQRDAARESARAFQNEWPGSPLERRVSAACP